MKKKVIAFLIASTMLIEPFSVANATEFSDGEEEKVESQFSDDAKLEYEPEISDLKLNQFNAKDDVDIRVVGQEMNWKDANTVKISFVSNVSGKYYVKWVKRGEKAPTINIAQDGTSIDAGTTVSVEVSDIPDYDIDIYVCVVSNDDKGKYGSVMFQPISADRPSKKIDSIKVGDNIIATVTEDTLVLSGVGETYDGACPWSQELEKTKLDIKSIVVEEGITYIGKSLFSHFENVKTITLPTSLDYIGTEAFSNCYSLENIEIPEGVKIIEDFILNECSGLKSISLPSTLQTVPCLIDLAGESVEKVILNEGIKRIGDSAFQNMSNLKDIIIPKSVSSIGKYAFADCTSLTDFSLPDSITEIDSNAFRNCISIDKIVLPTNLTVLGKDVFVNCNAEITFPESLKHIPELGSNSVRKVAIPEGVEGLEDFAFFECKNLTEINLPSTINTIGECALNKTGITTFNCPEKVINMPFGLLSYTALTDFSVPETVTEIADEVFYNCTNLNKILIPKSVVYIGSDVFKYCKNLTVYGYKDSVAESYAKANNINFVSADYKVIFKDNGRTKKTEYVTKGQNATPPTLDAKAGYTLSWDADYTNITEDMVINAVWTKKDSGSSGGGTTIIVTPSESTKYTVTFKDRGKIVKTEKVKSGDAAEYPFISRSGYELSWDKDFSKVTADTTVNAVWTVIKPAKVTSLTAEAGKTSIALSWDETEYTSYYLVYRKADAETEYTQVAKTTKVLWTDSKAVPGTQYSYKVVAVRSLDGKKYQGADSDIVTTKIGTPQIGDVYSVGNLNYKIISVKEVSVTGLAKEEVEIKIPSAVSISGKAYKVTSIQEKAFCRNEDIISVTIGNNVTEVGKYAFYQCSGLETVKFGKRVVIINTCAFTQCLNLENVTLPSSIRRIGAKAFYQCTSIKALKLNGSNLEYVGKKGLAVNKSVTLKLPKKSYTMYKNLIKASSIYSKTKFSKF